MNNKWFRLLALGAASALLVAGAVQQKAEPKKAPQPTATKPATPGPVLPPGFTPPIRPPASSKSKASSKQEQKSEAKNQKKATAAKTISSSGAAHASSKSAPKAGIITLPPDATPLGTNTYAHTDASGKKWIYKTTPFGVHRTEVTGQEGSAQAGSAEHVKVTDAGDQLQFERSTPFGMSTWTKKKSELTAWEKQVWEEQKRGKAPGNQKD